MNWKHNQCPGLCVPHPLCRPGSRQPRAWCRRRRCSDSLRGRRPWITVVRRAAERERPRQTSGNRMWRLRVDRRSFLGGSGGLSQWPDPSPDWAPSALGSSTSPANSRPLWSQRWRGRPGSAGGKCRAAGTPGRGKGEIHSYTRTAAGTERGE